MGKNNDYSVESILSEIKKSREGSANAPINNNRFENKIIEPIIPTVKEETTEQKSKKVEKPIIQNQVLEVNTSKDNNPTIPKKRPSTLDTEFDPSEFVRDIRPRSITTQIIKEDIVSSYEPKDKNDMEEFLNTSVSALNLNDIPDGKTRTDIYSGSGHTQELIKLEHEFKKSRKNKIDEFFSTLEGEEKDEEENKELISQIPNTTPPIITPIIQNFTTFETTLEEPINPSEQIEDFNSYADTEHVFNDLKSLKLKMSIRSLITFLAVMIMLYIEIAPKFSLPFASSLSHITNPTFYILSISILLTFCIIACFTAISGGIISLFKLKADSDSLVSISSLACFGQCLYLILNSDSVKTSFVYAILACVGLYMNSLGKLIIINRVKRNFKFASALQEKYIVTTIEDQQTSTDFSRGLEKEVPVTAISQKVGFLTGFLENSYCEDPSDAISRILAPISVVCSAAIAVVIYITSKNMTYTISVFTAGVCICSPITSLLSSNVFLGTAAKRLSKAGAIIPGYTSVEQFQDINGVVASDADIFPKESIVLHGIKTYGQGKIDDAILDAASVVCTAGGTLKDIFMQVIEEKVAYLREVDSIVYEDGMGISGWIGPKRILVGNRELMKNHGVPVPTSDSETKYIKGGRDVVYLSTSGELSAMFVISYNANDYVNDAFYRLYKNKMTITIYTTDSNITIDKIASVFDFPEERIKVLPSILHRSYQALTKPIETAETSVSHIGTFYAFVRSIVCTISLKTTILLSTSLQTAGVLIGFTLVGIFSLLYSPSMLDTLLLLSYQLLWGFAAIFLPKLRRL